MDKARICKGFCPRTKREQDFHLKQLLIEMALRPQPTSAKQDPALSSSVPSAPAIVVEAAPENNSGRDPRHCCSLAPKPTGSTQHRSHSLAHSGTRSRGRSGISGSETHPIGADQWGVSQRGAPSAEVFGDSTVDLGPGRGTIKFDAVGLPGPGHRGGRITIHPRHL